MGEVLKNGLSEDLCRFIRENFPRARQKEVGLTNRLLEEGIVDSLGLLVIVEHIESTYGITVGSEDLEMENFGTIASLSEFVGRRLAGRA